MISSVVKAASAFSSFRLSDKTAATVCDTVDPLAEEFDATRYMGLWYDIQHSSDVFFQPPYFDCTTAKYYNLDADAGTFTVYNSVTVGRLPRFGIKIPSSVAGLPSGYIDVGQGGSANYYVLDTDYETYTLVYSCNSMQTPMLWILARTPTLDQDLIDRLNAEAAQKLPNYDFSLATLSKQGGKCKYND